MKLPTVAKTEAGCEKSKCKEQSVGNVNTEYLGTIVAAATLVPSGNEINTALKCRKRPERKPCKGSIHARLHEEPIELVWWCSECGDSGVIQNWKGTPWNRAHVRNRGKIENSGDYCEVILSDKEFELLNEISILEPGAQKIVDSYIFISRGFLLVGTVENMDDLIGYIAFEANFEQNQRRQNYLYGLFDKIHAVITQKW